MGPYPYGWAREHPPHPIPLPRRAGEGGFQTRPYGSRATRCRAAPGESPSPQPSPVEGEGVRAPFHARYSVVLSGWRHRAVSGRGVWSRWVRPGVGLVPVLFEFFVDSALGGGELRGCGYFVLYALGPQGLSANGGPGVSVPAALCSGPSCPGPSCFVVLGSFGGLRVSGVGCGGKAPAAPLGSGFRRNDG